MALFGKSKKELLEWQNLLMPNSNNKLILNESQLQNMSYRTAEDHLRIVHDSASLCKATKNPEIFFSRYDLLLDHAHKLAILSKYVKFTGPSPVDAYNQTISQRPEAIRDLINRCFADVSTLLTGSAKAKRYQKLLIDFLPYSNKMDNANWNYLSEVCIREIKEIVSSGNANKLKQIIEIIAELNKYITQVKMSFNMPNEIVVNPYFTDPSKTKIEKQPLTDSGKVPKYTKKLTYSTIGPGKSQSGEAWLLPDDSIGKARMITWINRNGIQINLAIINDSLNVSSVEVFNNPSAGWQVLYNTKG